MVGKLSPGIGYLASEVASRIEGHVEFFGLACYHKFRMITEKVFDRLFGAIIGNVGVLHDEIAAWRDQGVVGGQLFAGVFEAVIGIGNHEDNIFIASGFVDLCNDGGFCAGADDLLDAPVHWPDGERLWVIGQVFSVMSFDLVSGKDVNGDDSSFLDDVEHVSHEKTGAAGPRAALDDQIRPHSTDQLLVYPKIEGTLQDRRGVPIGMTPDFGMVIEIMKLTGDFCAG